MKLYSRREWKEFRERVFAERGKICEMCHRGIAAGVVLHIHHIYYIPQRKPWEYSADACRVLCQGCHGIEHGLVRPSFGWELLCEDDLGSLEGCCEACNTDLRYVFTIFHEKWRSMEVGSDCCDRLTQTTLASHNLALRQSLKKSRKNFIENGWKIEGKTLKRIFDNIVIRITCDEIGSAYVSCNEIPGKKKYDDINSAKEHLFKIIKNGELRYFLING